MTTERRQKLEDQAVRFFAKTTIELAALLKKVERETWLQVVEKAQQASNDSASPEWILEWAKAQAEAVR